MAYPPPPYKDAVCGTPVAGEALCGAWWVYPSSARLNLGANLPVLTVIIPGVVTPAGLGLGAYPLVAKVTPFIQSAGLGLGAVVPRFSVGVAVPQAGLLLRGVVPGFRISSILHPDTAGLGLGTYLPQAEQEWLKPVEPILVPLTPLVCSELVLTPLTCIDLPLEPMEVRR